MLSKEELEDFGGALKKEKERLQKEIENLGETDMGSDVTDLGEEEADETEAAFTKESVAYSLNQRLKGIKLALDKIGAGAYGVCEDCGEKISLELLEANPESRLCKNCKEKKEKDSEE